MDKQIIDLVNNIINKSEPTLEEMINCLDLIKENKFVLIKLDGLRDNKKYYTIFISSENDSDLQVSGFTLKEAILKALKEYIA